MVFSELKQSPSVCACLGCSCTVVEKDERRKKEAIEIMIRAYALMHCCIAVAPDETVNLVVDTNVSIQMSHESTKFFITFAYNV